MRFRAPALSVLCLALLAGCSIPGPSSGKAELAALDRQSIPVPNTPGREVSYLHAGDPSLPQIVYIHGTPGDATAWADYLSDPIPGFESIAIDRPGFGRSVSSRDPRTDKPLRTAVPSFADQAAAIVPLLHVRNGRGAILVGHSLGGPIAARLAADHPELVGGLVILAGSLDPDQEVWAWYNEMATWWAVNWWIPDEMLIANAEVAQAKAQTTLLANMLPHITCPVVWVQGGKDGLVPPENAAYAKRMMTSAHPFELIELPDANHFLPWEHADVVRHAISRAAELARPVDSSPLPVIGSTGQPAPARD